MTRQAYIWVNYNNITVLKKYLDIIHMSLRNIGYSCEYITTMKGISKKALIVYPMGKDAFKYYFKGYHNFILWQQGATADESFMRNHSNLRYRILNFIDCFSMKKARFIFYVSNYMKKHYELLAHMNFSNKSYIMPCYNEEIDKSIFAKKDYTKKIFSYVGSLDLWQCFDRIVELYAQIECANKNSMFKVLTFQVDEAKKILEKKKVKNFVVKYVPQNELKNELIEATYGFVIREDNMVNRVATPTKISSYLASGVLPIYSTCLIDFYEVSQGYSCTLGVGTSVQTNEIIEFINKPIDVGTISNEIIGLFDCYYNTNKHVQNITSNFKKILGD